MRPRKTRIEDGSPWRWFAKPDPDQEYLAVATYIQLRSTWALPRFEWYTQLVHRQLARSPGLVGYSFRGRLPTRYWTISAWESQRHLLGFMRAMPHTRVMGVLPVSIERFGSARWQVNGAALPLAWSEALRRLDAQDALRRNRA